MSVTDALISLLFLLLGAQGTWFWTWKRSIDSDLREARDGMLKLPAIIQSLDKTSDKLAALVPETQQRLGALENHRVYDETRLATAERDLRKLGDWKLDHEIRTVEDRSVLHELQRKVLGDSPPGGIRGKKEPA